MRLFNSVYRIQIYLPISYNDGTKIEANKFSLTKEELIKKFGGITAMPLDPNLALDGWWQDKGTVYKDKIVILQVDCKELNKRFLKKYKSLLKKRFKQEEIYISSSEVEII